MENSYDEDSKICEYALTFFVKNGKEYTRIDETHYQRAYEVAEILNLLKKAGFDGADIFDGISKNTPVDTSERIFFVTQK